MEFTGIERTKKRIGKNLPQAVSEPAMTKKDIDARIEANKDKMLIG